MKIVWVIPNWSLAQNDGFNFESLRLDHTPWPLPRKFAHLKNPLNTLSNCLRTHNSTSLHSRSKSHRLILVPMCKVSENAKWTFKRIFSKHTTAYFHSCLTFWLVDSFLSSRPLPKFVDFPNDGNSCELMESYVISLGSCWRVWSGSLFVRKV